MKMMAKRVSDKQGLGRCSWCGKKTKRNAPVYGLGARKRAGMDLAEYEGSLILISLVTVPKEVICMVTVPGSQAWADGKDLMFMTCSEACAIEMKSVMEAETALGKSLFGDLEAMKN